jgi:hypothetical protein
LGLIFSDRFELLETLIEPLLVEQAPPGGIGGHGGAIQSATLSCRQFRLDRLMPELGIEGVDVSTGALAKLLPATPWGTNAKAQPPKRIALERVPVPLTGVALTAPQLKEHDGQHEIGPMRRFAATAVSLVEGNQVEGNHGVSNLPREMIVGQLRIELAPELSAFIPGRLGKTSGYLGIGWRVIYHLSGLLVGVAEWHGTIYSAQNPKNPKD